jgi:drug/metabolite transporter (DMT)-like permease
VPFSRKALVNVGLLVLVNAMWAAQYAAYKTATQQMGPITVSAWTFLLASLVLSLFLISERSRSGRPAHSQGSTPAEDCSKERCSWARRDLIGFVMVGVLGLVPASAFLAWGETLSTASNAALIYLTVPIITALLAVAILGEKMTLVRWASLALSLVGVLILSDFDWHHLELANSRFLLGNVLVLLACASSSFYNVYSKELLRRFSPLEVLVYGYGIALVISLPLLLWVEGFSLAAVGTYTGATWLALLVLSSISWGLAMVLWMFLLKRLDVSQASVSIYLLPLFGVLISAATLKEKITPTMIVGGAVTLIGTILITSTEAKAQ